MPHDQAYLQAEQHSANNHPRIKPSTNSRMRAAHIRLFVAPFVDGLVENKGGYYGA